MIQPNCSELVVELTDVVKLEVIREALKKIEKITKQKVYWVADLPDLKKILIPADIETIDIASAGDSLDWVKPKNLEEEVSKVDKDAKIEFVSLALCPKGKARKIGCDDESQVTLSVNAFDPELEEGPLRLRAEQHCVTRNFKPMMEVASVFPHKIFSLDGGSTFDLEEWLEKKGRKFLKKVNIENRKWL